MGPRLGFRFPFGNFLFCLLYNIWVVGLVSLLPKICGGLKVEEKAVDLDLVSKELVFLKVKTAVECSDDCM